MEEQLIQAIQNTQQPNPLLAEAQKFLADRLTTVLARQMPNIPSTVTPKIDTAKLQKNLQGIYDTAQKERDSVQRAREEATKLNWANHYETSRHNKAQEEIAEARIIAQVEGAGGSGGSGGSNGNLTVEEADTVKNHTEKVENPNLRTLDGTLSTLNSVSTSGRWEKDKDGKYVAKPDSLWGEIGNNSILAFSPAAPLWGLSKLTSGDNFLKDYTKAASNYLTTPEVRNAISNLSPKEVDALMQKIENTIASKADGLAWYQNSYKTSDGKSLSSQEIVQRDLVPILTEFLKGSLDSKVVQAKHGLKVGNNKQNIR